MSKTVHELIRLARKEAGISQESAAPKLYLSVKQLKNMESGALDVDPATISRMSSLYFKPLLAVQYVNACAEAAGMGPITSPEPRPLPVATMALINRIYDFADNHRDRALLRIAEDGVIDATEKPEFQAIMDELSEIVRAATDLKYSI